MLNVFRTFSFILTLVVFAPPTVHAQDDVETLGNILNPVNPDDMSTATTAKEMANVYFSKCVKERSFAFNDTEKEMLCACTASKVAQVLTPKEFRYLYSDTNKGRDARGKVIAFAYLDCIPLALEDKLRADCKGSPSIARVAVGKKKVCDCTIDQYIKLVDSNSQNIIMDAIEHDPMTLNPLERHFMDVNYDYQYERYAKSCRGMMLYKK